MAYTFVRQQQADGTEVGSFRSNGIEQFQIDPTISAQDQEMFSYMSTALHIGNLNSGQGSVDVPSRTITLTSPSKTWTASQDKDRDEIQAMVAALASATGWTVNQATTVLRIMRGLNLAVMRKKGVI